MRFLVPILILSAALSASAAGVFRAGPETLLGAPVLQPWDGRMGRRPAIASDGVDILAVGASIRYPSVSLHGVLLDRHGRALTPEPRLLAADRDTPIDPYIAPRVVWAGGFYVVFYSTMTTPQGGFRDLHALRLTRDLEVVDTRVLPSIRGSFDVAVHGDELLIVGQSHLLRLQPDLTVIATQPLPASYAAITVGPDGPVILTARDPAALAFRLDGGQLARGVRVASLDSVRDASIVWTGIEYVVTWTECRYDCYPHTVRLGRDLHPLSEDGLLDLYCDCGEGRFSASAGGDGTVVFTWYHAFLSQSGWRAQRFRNGVALDAKPLAVGGAYASFFRTADGTLLAIDGAFHVAEVPLPGAGTEVKFAPAAYAPAAEEAYTAARATAHVGVVVRTPDTGLTKRVTLLSDTGAIVREMNATDAVTLAPQGDEFYAVNNSYLHRFGADGDNRLRIPSADRLPRAFAWNGTSFSSAAFLREERQELVRIDRIGLGGNARAPCTSLLSIREADARAAVIAGNPGDMLMVWGNSFVWFRDGCPDGEVQQGPHFTTPPVSNGRRTWAMLRTDANLALRIAFANSGRSFHDAPTPIVPRGYAYLASLAAAGDHWVAAYGGIGTLFPFEVALLDADGTVVERLSFPNATHPRLVQLDDDEVLLLYTRIVDEAPYSGTPRIAARRLSIVTGTQNTQRGRGVRR